MAVIEPRVFHPRRPDAARMWAENNVVVTYDRVSDTLMLHLFGTGRPSVSMPISDCEYLLLDPRTEEVIGLQIEDFVTHAVYTNRTYPDYAELAGFSEALVAAIRAESDRRWHALDDDGRKRALLDTLFSALPPAQGIA